MNQEQLAEQNKQELIEIILRQHQQIEELMEAFKKLKADYEALVMKFEHNQKPPTNSGNSSQPPSKDQKKNKPKDKGKRHHGPPKGHEKHERELVANPDKIIELHVESCEKCQCKLEHEAEKLVRVNQITELPEIRGQVIEVRQYEKVCAHCGVKQRTQAPDGLYTAPSDSALRFDIEFAKDIGCNLIRKHVKLEPLRWYAHCDRLGMLVWQDMPNGGIPPSGLISLGPMLFSTTHSNVKDLNCFGRAEEGNRERYLQDLQSMVEHLYNTACISAWVPFNEAWGQFSARSVAEMLKLWDPTRSVDHASGWFDEGAGDWRSLHIYGFKLSPGKPDERAFVLSEFGGYGLRLNGHIWHPKRKFGLRYFKDEGELASAYADLLEKQLEPLISQGLAAAVYTQVTDVEIEMNGWLTYDRRVEKIPRATLKRLHTSLFAHAQAELEKG